MKNLNHMTAAASLALASGARIECREEDPIDRMTRAFTEHSQAMTTRLGQMDEAVTALRSRLDTADARRPASPAISRMGGIQPEQQTETRAAPVTMGEQASDLLTRSADRERMQSPTGRIRMETRAETITSAPASAGALVAPQRVPGVLMLPHRRLVVRSLLGRGRTSSNAVEFMRQTGFVNRAAPTAEGDKKPMSEISFELSDAKVRTIPHYVKASRQIIEDAPLLISTVDGELRYGLDEKEEDQVLNGNGVGQNILGLVPQATEYDTDRNVPGDTEFDTILHAIEQAELAKLPASGIMLHTSDWFRMLGIKDNDGNYIGGGPLAAVPDRIWRMPVVWTTAIAQGTFLVGAFEAAATIYDRQDTILEFGYENDDFTRNLVTILAEKRLALAVKRPEALVKGSFVAALPR